MTCGKWVALAGLVATAAGVQACNGPSIVQSPPAIEVQIVDDGGVVETFAALVDSGVDFGSQPVLIPTQRVLTISNLGSGGLTVSSATILSDAGAFSIAGTIPTTIDNNGDPLTVQFAPPEQASYAAILEIVSNDTANGVVDIPLTGVGSTGGKLDAEPNPVNFGSVGQGQLQTATLTLSSVGTAPLLISGIAMADGGDPAFQFVSSVSLPAGGEILDAGASQQFVLSFSPTESTPANATGTVVIQSSDPTQQPAVVQLTGQGVLAPVPIIIAPQTVAQGDTVWLDGGTSYDPNQPPLTPLTYSWAIYQKPLGSTASLPADTLTQMATDAVLDLPGNYIFQLWVTNTAGVRSVTAAQATVLARATNDLVVQMSWDNTPIDMDLHLLDDGGVLEGPGDCNAYSPDAGFDCVPGSDHLVGPGPETVAIAIPPDGDYEADCVLYSAHNAKNLSTNVTIRVYLYGVLSSQLCQTVDSVGQVWRAATISWPSGTVTPIGASGTCSSN